jgi:hypothetical protein
VAPANLIPSFSRTLIEACPSGSVSALTAATSGCEKAHPTRPLAASVASPRPLYSGTSA